MSALWLHLGCAALFLLPALTAEAEFRRVEATGHYRLRDAMRSKIIARDEAVAIARWEGVSGVALGLIQDATREEIEIVEAGTIDTGDTPHPDLLLLPEAGETVAAESEPEPERPSAELVSAVRKALGRNLLPYMRRYRILEDRGEVPVLVGDESELRIEYVVVVEVLVDIERVQSALESAGLIVATTWPEAGAPIVVEMLGLSRFEAVEKLERGLREEFGATDVQTLEYTRGRQLLRVEGPFGPEELSAMLARWQSPRLYLEPIGVDSMGRRIRLMGRWFPEPEEEPEGEAAAMPPAF
ncbi:MAG: hypothetical protein VCB25_06355 [Myxococcota bacterium]